MNTQKQNWNRWAVALALLTLGACSSSTQTETAAPAPARVVFAAPSPDPRVGLKAGKFDAATALWNMRLLSTTPSPDPFSKSTNSDLAFLGNYAFQGNYNGFQVWDISNPAQPTMRKAFFCPASQSDVSVYRNLLFVSGEGFGGRLDCGGGGVPDSVSPLRLRGLRIFDITNLDEPKYVGNVQTCRGSHTHTLLEDPADKENVYVYISGSAPVRSPSELPGCVNAAPDKDPNSSLFRIEVIKVPLANPAAAAIVSSPRIFNNLTKAPSHGETAEDKAASAQRLAAAKARGQFTAVIFGSEQALPTNFTGPRLDSIMKARGGTGTPTGADSAALRAALPGIIAKLIGDQGNANAGPTQCHDITVYPAVGLAGGACEGYGFLIDIRDPAHPVRLTEAADSNFSYWHSATFNNDGTKVLFSDEWGGGGGPKCRAADPHQWGADAIFTIENGKLRFHNYYKMTAPQTSFENCVAHNGSIIPVPGRDIMVQSWYQGGISVFDWTDPAKPYEIAFFDRGPADSTRMGSGGTWSAYWYNGVIVSSEISRGLDILELTPSAALTQNELDAAKSVRLDHLNVQGQPKYVWPATFALARAYLDQLERNNGISAARIAAIRTSLSQAEAASDAQRRSMLTSLAGTLEGEASGARDAAKVKLLAGAVRGLAR